MLRHLSVCALLALFLQVFALSCPPTAGATGCSTDRDCKGERICINAVCQDPPSLPGRVTGLSICGPVEHVALDVPHDFASSMALSFLQQVLVGLGAQTLVETLPRLVSDKTYTDGPAQAFLSPEGLRMIRVNMAWAAEHADDEADIEARFVMAHEFAHHLEGDARRRDCDEKAEIRADSSAVRMLRREGVSAAEIDSLTESLRRNGLFRSGPCHPAEAERVANIRAVANVGPSTGQAASKLVPQQARQKATILALASRLDDDMSLIESALTLALCGCNTGAPGDTELDAGCASGIRELYPCFEPNQRLCDGTPYGPTRWLCAGPKPTAFVLTDCSCHPGESIRRAPECASGYSRVENLCGDMKCEDGQVPGVKSCTESKSEPGGTLISIDVYTTNGLENCSCNNPPLGSVQVSSWCPSGSLTLAECGGDGKPPAGTRFCGGGTLPTRWKCSPPWPNCFYDTGPACRPEIQPALADALVPEPRCKTRVARFVEDDKVKCPDGMKAYWKQCGSGRCDGSEYFPDP